MTFVFYVFLFALHFPFNYSQENPHKLPSVIQLIHEQEIPGKVESRKQEKGQAGLAYGDTAWLFHVSPEPAPAGFDPFERRVPQIPLLAMGSRVQHLSRKLQSIKPLNCRCTKKTAPLAVQGMVRS